MITKPTQWVLYTMIYNFGKEIVALDSQSFWSFQMNYLIHECIFGKDFSKIKMSELVYQSKRATLIHTSSINRARQSFCIDGLSGVTFAENSLKFSASPKSIVESYGKEISLHFISHTANKLEIHTTNNDTIECCAPKWINKTNNYQYKWKSFRPPLEIFGFMWWRRA